MPEIHGVKFVTGEALFNVGVYAVYVGYIDTPEKKNDIPHYLVVNTKHNVIEGSSANVFEARGQCAYFNAQMEAQDKRIEDKKPLYEEDDSAAAAAVRGSTWN